MGTGARAKINVKIKKLNEGTYCHHLKMSFNEYKLKV